MTEADEAGFAVPDVPTWSGFVASGELARTLTRACSLAGPLCEIGYRLAVAGERCVLTIVIDGHAHVREIAADGAAWVNDGLAAVVDALNGALGERGRGERFEIVERSGALHGRRRIVVRDHAELAIAPIDARVDRRFDGDGSLLGLISDYVERLCRFAELPHITCRPRWMQEPGVLTFTFEHRPPDSGGVTRTLRLRAAPELDVQTILDTINGELDAEGRRLYRIAREPGRADVALLDKQAAAELRRAGELIERPAREALRELANAGFELPSLYGEWKNWGGYRIRESLRRIGLLARGIAAIDCAIDVDGDDATTLTWTIDGKATAVRYGAELADHPATLMLARIAGDLNRALAAAGIAHRCLVITGEPHFYGYRMVLLDREWLERVARCAEVLPGCLDEGLLAAIEHVIGMHPLAEPAGEPPRLPLMEEIVDRADILDHDFKCSARPSDFFSLIEELAQFARIAVEVAPHARSDGKLVAIDVTYRGQASTIRIEDQKYVNASPILEYLNALLDARKPRRQIYAFRGGGWSGGVVRATDEEAAQLRALGYI
jgi:hypothetical protein